MDSYRMIEGVFTYVVFLSGPRKVAISKFLGWQPEEKVLWIVPCDTSFRSEHITGSQRSRAIRVDSIESIRNVSGIRRGLEVRWRDHAEGQPTTIRLLESRRQGRIPEVEFLLRTAWNGWRPAPEEESDAVSEQLIYSIDGSRLPAGTTLSAIAMYYLATPDSPPDWTLTVDKVKRLVEQQSGTKYEEVDSFSIEVNGHTLSRDRVPL